MSIWNLVSLQGSRNVLSTFPCVTRSLSEETLQMFWPHYRLLRLFEGFSVAQTAIRDLSKISKWKEALLWSFEVKLLIPGLLQTSLFSLHITSCFSSVSPFFFFDFLMSFATASFQCPLKGCDFQILLGQFNQWLRQTVLLGCQVTALPAPDDPPALCSSVFSWHLL